MTSPLIVDLDSANHDRVESIVKFLPACFSKYSPSWLPDRKAALDEILESFESNRRSRVMLGSDGEPIGWIGAIVKQTTWEIHPIAVSPHHQGHGIGRLLVLDIERLASESGAVSIWAGTGDETNSTSFSQFDLYRDFASSLKNIQAPNDHPVNFWLNMGYSIVGVLPDDEGLGKPSIHFAKRIV